jgi:hypothetical protein
MEHFHYSSSVLLAAALVIMLRVDLPGMAGLTSSADQLQQLQAADDEGMHKSKPAAGTTADLLGRASSILSRIDADLKQASKVQMARGAP